MTEQRDTIEKGLGDRLVFQVHDPDHTPDRMTWAAGRNVDAKATLTVADCQADDGRQVNPAGFIELTVREVTTDKNGRARERSISMTLDAPSRAALIAMLAGRNMLGSDRSRAARKVAAALGVHPNSLADLERAR